MHLIYLSTIFCVLGKIRKLSYIITFPFAFVGLSCNLFYNAN